MTNTFQGPIAGELHAFLQFKRSLGYGYMRAEFTLREFDRFLIHYAAGNRRWKLDRAAIAWLSSKPCFLPSGRVCGRGEAQPASARSQAQERREDRMPALRNLEVGVMFWRVRIR